MAVPNYCLKDAQGYPLKDAQGYPRKSTATCESCCGGGPDPGCCPSTGGDIARNCGKTYACVMEFHQDWNIVFGTSGPVHPTLRRVTDLVAPASFARVPGQDPCNIGVYANVSTVKSDFNGTTTTTTTTTNNNYQLGLLQCIGVTNGAKTTKMPNAIPTLSYQDASDYPAYYALDSGGSQPFGSSGITENVTYSWSVTAAGQYIFTMHYLQTASDPRVTVEEKTRNFRITTAIAGPCSSNPTGAFSCPIPGVPVLAPCPGCSHQSTDFREGF